MQINPKLYKEAGFPNSIIRSCRLTINDTTAAFSNGTYTVITSGAYPTVQNANYIFVTKIDGFKY